VLILTGVLGTIVSLSIALLGATDLISTGSETGGLATVIGGMSTALSTTMSAIVAYLIFGYFYLRVLDAQTHFLGRIEELSATHLVPRFQTSPDTLVNDYSRLLSTGTELIQRMDTTHKRFSNTAAEIELRSSWTTARSQHSKCTRCCERASGCRTALAPDLSDSQRHEQLRIY